MTEKLYYIQSHTRSFTARVTGCREEEEGWAVRLDKTAFFPGGGGQRCDQGMLGGEALLDVREEGEDVVHRCAAPLEVGSTVQGELDWPLRFGRMQLHSGEHVVSGLAHRLYGCENVGFHMSDSFVTLDFDRELDAGEIRALERAANEAVWANLPVRAWFPERAELDALDYRSKKELSGAVRLVEISGCDLCACCAPHVNATGEIGLIRFTDWMRHRRGVRLTMVAGRFAYEEAAALGAQAAALSAALSAPRLELEAAVARLGQELETAKYSLEALRRRDMERLAAGVEPGEENLCLFLEEADGAALRALVNALMDKRPLCAAFSGADGAWQYVIGSRRLDLRAAAKAINGAIDGRGGGSREMIQGSAGAGRQEIEKFIGGFHGQGNG